MNSIDIYHYYNYRDYIKKYYEEKKKANSKFSYRSLSLKANINSSGYFKDLITGVKNITPKFISKVCNGLQLNPEQSYYFSLMVEYTQSQQKMEQEKILLQMKSLKEVHSIRTLSKEQISYYSEWHHSVIRELVSHKDIQSNPKKIQTLIPHPLTLQEIENSIQLLLDLDLLEIVDGSYQQKEPLLASGEHVKNGQIQLYQMQMLQKAMKAFVSVPQGEKLMSSTTLFYSKENFQESLGLIRQLRKQLLAMAVTEADPKVVYQLNLNFFPLTKEI